MLDACGSRISCSPVPLTGGISNTIDKERGARLRKSQERKEDYVNEAF
jgi:hypothetical protein